MSFLSVVIALGLLFFTGYQIVGVVKDVRKHKKEKESFEKIEKDKTE